MDIKKILELKKKHHKLFVGGVIFLSLFIILFFGNMLPDRAEDQKQTNISTEQLTTGQQMERDVQKILGYDNITDFTYFEDTEQVIISYDANDYSSAITLHSDHIKIYEKLFEEYNVKEVSIFSLMTFVDTYGQETDLVGLRSMVTKETANKINWENLLTYNLPKVADTYYIHPALEE